MMRFIPKLLKYSTNLREGLTIESMILKKTTLILLKNIFGEPWNYLSIILGDSTSSIDTICSVSWRIANPGKRKIGEPQTQLSVLLGDSMNLREGLE
jgi:hypothetical protein